MLLSDRSKKFTFVGRRLKLEDIILRLLRKIVSPQLQ